MGAPSLPSQQAVETLATLTDATISAVSADCLSALFVEYPRLAVLFFLTAQVERTYLMDHITALGRCNAEQRIAGFLVHVAEKAN
jgi:CRP-like cAMP-binding protein